MFLQRVVQCVSNQEIQKNKILWCKASNHKIIKKKDPKEGGKKMRMKNKFKNFLVQSIKLLNGPKYSKMSLNFYLKNI